MKTIDTLDNQPFKRLITTIGALPTSFIDSMSYYEMLAWLCDYLANQVTPAVNNNAEALVELREYVEHYFDTADFQELVNNKLDEMAEDGTLADIISQYIDVNYVKKTDYATDETGGVVKVGDSLTIDANGVLNEKPFADFIDDIDFKQIRYSGIGGYTYVNYAIIPAEHKPNLVLAKGAIDNLDYVANMSYDAKATLAVNAGVFDTSTGETWGPLVCDGEYLLGQNHVYDNPHELLYMSSNGRLDVIDYTATEQQIMSLNPVWAVLGFYCYINNYQVQTTHINSTDFRERTIIGQDADGNYLIVVTGGRSTFDVGFSPQDALDFCTSISFTPRILYNLDGGGSSHITYRGITMNQLASDTGDTRTVPNVLAWSSPTAKSQAVFDEAQTVNNAIIAERRNDIPMNVTASLTVDSAITLDANSTFVVNNGIVTMNGWFTNAASLATYADLVSGLPAPFKTVPIQLVAKSTGACKMAYVSSGGVFRNWNQTGALAADTYYFNASYPVVNKPYTENLE